MEGLDLKGVEGLTFGDLFNQKVEGLDLKGVEDLTFGVGFNQKVEGLDLKGVKDLTFGYSFNQPVEGLDLEGVRVVLPSRYVGWRDYTSLKVYGLGKPVYSFADQHKVLYNSDCLVCGDQDNQELVVAECGHLYCYSCFKRWYDRDTKQCVYCRKPLSRDRVLKVQPFK